MKCNSCGYENIEGAVSCSNCMQSLGSDVGGESKAVNNAPATNDAPAAAVTYAPVVQTSAPAASYAAPAQRVAPSASAQPAPSAYTAQSSYNTAPARPVSYAYQQPYYYPQIVQRPKQQFTITDVYIIIGFVLAIVGVFAYAYILLPVSIGFSVVGFVKRTNARTLGLSIAGIVVGVVACLIKIGLVLNELGVIPDWLSAGIF